MPSVGEPGKDRRGFKVAGLNEASNIYPKIQSGVRAAFSPLGDLPGWRLPLPPGDGPAGPTRLSLV